MHQHCFFFTNKQPTTTKTSYMKTLLISAANLLATALTIIAFFLGFLSNEKYLQYSLITFVVFLLLLLVLIFYGIHKFMTTHNENGHIVKSAFSTYISYDGKKIEYESFFHIQCKKLWMDKYNWRYNWTGNDTPVVESKIQKVVESIVAKDKYNFATAVLKFNKPIVYNETLPVHFSSIMNDEDCVSKTHLLLRVTNPTDIVSFKAILPYKERASNAILERKKIDALVDTDFELIKYIPFNTETKSYSSELVSPEIGYFYRMRWERYEK